MGCCLTTDEKISNIFQKFKVISAGKAQADNFPQLVCGRILYNIAEEKLICPIKEKQCVYYKATAFELQGKHNTPHERFTEERWSDFYLIDPDYPNTKILIPARKTKVIVRGVDDGKAKSGAGAVSFFESEQLPKGIEDFLKRHNFSVEMNVLIGYSKRLMNYSEESFDVLEQLACLGIVKDGFDWTGQPIKVLHPIDVSSIPKSLFNEHNWSSDDISNLKSLINLSAIIASDDAYVFQGMRINQIPPSAIPTAVPFQAQLIPGAQFQQIPIAPQIIPQMIQQPQYPIQQQQQYIPQQPQYPLQQPVQQQPIQQQQQFQYPPQQQLQQQQPLYNQQFIQQQPLQQQPLQQPIQQQQYPPQYQQQPIQQYPPQQQQYPPPQQQPPPYSQQYNSTVVVPSGIPMQQYPQSQGIHFPLKSSQIYPS